MKLDVAPELEGVGEAVGRDRPGLGEVAHDLGIVRGIELEQRRVVRPHRMEERERGLRVAVVVGRFGADREDERAAGLGRLRERMWHPNASTAATNAKIAVLRIDHRASFAKSGRARTLLSIRNSTVCYTLMQAAKCIGSISRSCRHALLAFVRGHRAAGMEHAALRRIERARHLAAEHRAGALALELRIGNRHRVQQRLRVGMQRVGCKGDRGRRSPSPGPDTSPPPDPKCGAPRRGRGR